MYKRLGRFLKSNCPASVFKVMGPRQLGELIDRHASALVLYARQWCATPEDAVQEAFVKLARQRREPKHLVAWLYRVVRNGAISAGRSEQRRRNHESRAAARTPTWFCPSDGTDVDEVTEALSKLPLEQREVIVAHLWGGLTFAEIAEVSGGSASTAYRRYAEGVQELRKQMGVSCPS